MKNFKNFITESIKDFLDEAVEIKHDRYIRSHGKKASGGHGMWMFTNKNMGNVDYDDEKEVFTAPSGKFSDAKTHAKKWAKQHGHSQIYIMESSELDEVSDETLAKYIGKSKKDLDWKKGLWDKNAKQAEKRYLDIENRRKGIKTAINKLTREENKLGEIKSNGWIVVNSTTNEPQKNTMTGKVIIYSDERSAKAALNSMPANKRKKYFVDPNFDVWESADLAEISVKKARDAQNAAFDRMVAGAGTTKKDEYGNNKYVPADEKTKALANKAAKQAGKFSSYMAKKINKEEVELDEAFKIGDSITYQKSKKERGNAVISGVSAAKKNHFYIKTEKEGTIMVPVGELELKEHVILDEAKNKGLWHNIHARRKKGLPPKKPGEEGYPETLDIKEISDKKLDAYRQKAFADQPAGDDGSDKYRKRKFGRDLAFDKQVGRAKVRATKESVEELDEISTEKLRSYASAALQDKNKGKADKRWKYAGKAMNKVADREVKAAHDRKYNKMEETDINEIFDSNYSGMLGKFKKSVESAEAAHSKGNSKMRD